MDWTNERVEELRRLWGQGQTASRIADLLGGASLGGLGRGRLLNQIADSLAGSCYQYCACIVAGLARGDHCCFEPAAIRVVVEVVTGFDGMIDVLSAVQRTRILIDWRRGQCQRASE